MNGIVMSEEYPPRFIYELFVDEENHTKLVEKLSELDEQEVWTFKARNLHSQCAKMLCKEIFKEFKHRVKNIDFDCGLYNEKYGVYYVRAWEV